MSIFRLIYPFVICLLHPFAARRRGQPASQPTSWCTQCAGLLIKQQTGTMASSLYEHGPSKTRGKKVEWKFDFFFFEFSSEKKILCGTRIILSLSVLFCVRSSIVFSPLDVCAVCVCCILEIASLKATPQGRILYLTAVYLFLPTRTLLSPLSKVGVSARSAKHIPNEKRQGASRRPYSAFKLT